MFSSSIHDGVPGTDVMLLCFFAKKMWNAVSYAKIWIIKLDFNKTPLHSRKLAKIAENCDHNIDPWKMEWSSLTISAWTLKPCVCMSVTSKNKLLVHALAVWYCCHRVRLLSRGSLVQIPLGNRVFGFSMLQCCSLKSNKHYYCMCERKNRFLAMAAWHSGHRVRLYNRRSRIRIPPWCKVFRSLKCCCQN
jgi:hypothetical protein